MNPIIGATGIDFGTKAAISFVIPHKKPPTPPVDICSGRDYYSYPIVILDPQETCRIEYSNPPAYDDVQTFITGVST